MPLSKSIGSAQAGTEIFSHMLKKFQLKLEKPIGYPILDPVAAILQSKVVSQCIKIRRLRVSLCPSCMNRSTRTSLSSN